ncbi:MAG: Nmad2 family putative nucleotide modification protein [Gallionellaceae bacterium]
MGNYLYIYVVDRDFGFAPNPFHGYCTLATCKPKIRRHAQIGDWIMGVGGCRLKATGNSIYLMKVSEILTFNEYWSDERFYRKRPARNGSLVMMVGDNIYHQEPGSDSWIQEDSHHSNPDGTTNQKNLERDTSAENVLVSNHFYYFGKSAPPIDLASIGYKNHIGESKKLIANEDVAIFLYGIEQQNKGGMNLVLDDPFDFLKASKRVDQVTGKIT